MYTLRVAPITGVLGAENASGAQVYSWTYSLFEEFTECLVTPSMYKFMVGHVIANFADDKNWSELAKNAADAYWELIPERKYSLHELAMSRLQEAHDLAEEKEHAAMNATLDDQEYPGTPFDRDNPIHKEVMTYIHGLVRENRKEREEYERLLYEEENWRPDPMEE